jgi:tetratricopeptide (TPR) repeat protein
LTARDEALAEHPREAKLLDEVQTLAGSRSMAIGPLARIERTALVQGLLGLEGDLARKVEERTGGNPLFAVQLVGDWVQRGVLEVGETGFVLKAGEEAVLPDDIHEVWKARIQRLLEGRPKAAARALELAAALGRDEDGAEWRAACQQAGVVLPTGLLEALFASRLAQPAGDGWTFVHGMLRESLEREAVEAGRWQEHNRSCAAMLEARYDIDQAGIAERAARHLLAAGDLERAIEPLYKAASQRYDTSEYASAHVLLKEREEALGAVGAPSGDYRWGQGWCLMSAAFNWQGLFDDALTIADRAREAAVANDWSTVLAKATRLQGYAEQQRGNLSRSLDCYEGSLELYEELGDDKGRALALNGLGEVARLRGDNEKSIEHNTEALRLFEALDHDIGVSTCLRGLGVVKQHRNDLSGAADLYERALALYEKTGNLYGVATCLNDLAEVARFEGDIEEAERFYRRSQTMFDTTGSADGILPRLNLGLILLLRDKHVEAREQLEQGREELEQMGRRAILGAIHPALMLCAAKVSDWSAFDEHFHEAVRLLDETALVDADAAWPAQQGAEIALRAGEVERARKAFELALSQWTALEDEERTKEVESKLAGIKT